MNLLDIIIDFFVRYNRYGQQQADKWLNDLAAEKEWEQGFIDKIRDCVNNRGVLMRYTPAKDTYIKCANHVIEFGKTEEDHIDYVEPYDKCEFCGENETLTRELFDGGSWMLCAWCKTFLEII